MPFLKVIVINKNGVKTAIAESSYDPEKHTLWVEGGENKAPLKPMRKPVDLDFEPEPEQTDEKPKGNFRRKKK